MSWDHEVEVLVIGTGNGAMTAALCAHQMGSKNVLLLEKSDKYGGTSGVSGGGVWIPNNRYAKAAGVQDSVADAKAYLMSTIPEGKVPEHLIDTYLANGPKMVDFLHDNSRVRYISLEHYPDYYMQSPGARAGHRSMEPEPIKRSELGEDWLRVQETHHMMYMFNRIGMTQEEAHILMTNAKGWIALTMKMILGWVFDIPWRLKDPRARRLTCGCAGTTRLFLSLRDRQIPIWFNTPMTELIQDDDGRVVGVVAKKEGKDFRIKAAKGVILAAGGFEQNQQMREQYLPKPTNAKWSGGVATNTGDAHRAAMQLGAKTRLMDSAWWCTTVFAPDEPSPRLSIIEKSMPGSCVVNLRGKRIANESQNYMAYSLEYFAKHSDADPQTPSYFVFDARFRKSYICGPLMTSQIRSDKSLPQSYFDSGFLAIADSIEELANKLGIDPQGLRQTIDNMNEYAKTGKDLEFGRGDTEYDRYYGDQSITPNPCLAPIDQAPFYAMKIDPGDFGTHGGMEINDNAQVIAEATGAPIAGLYAIGNCAAAVLPTYPGPGSTLGPAMTFGYQAAKHITGYQD